MKKLTLAILFSLLLTPSTECLGQLLPGKRVVLTREGIKGPVKSIEDWIYRADYKSDSVVRGAVSTIDELAGVLSSLVDGNYSTFRTFSQSGDLETVIGYKAPGDADYMHQTYYGAEGFLDSVYQYQPIGVVASRSIFIREGAELKRYEVFKGLSKDTVFRQVLNQKIVDNIIIERFNNYDGESYVGYEEKRKDGILTIYDIFHISYNDTTEEAWYFYGSNNRMQKLKYKMTIPRFKYGFFLFYDYSNEDRYGNWTEKHIYVSFLDHKPIYPKYVMGRTIRYWDDPAE